KHLWKEGDCKMNRRKKYLACFLILMIISTNLPAISSGNVKKEEEVKQSYSTISTSDTLSSGIILSDSSLSGTVAGEQSSEECFVDGETEANTSENGQTTTDTPAP
ncbi:MAG: hypothetical protein LUF92_12895, partial [Clostridiales bacterium]|nr:hypothetical protein [Clostridiales bacterium]